MGKREPVVLSRNEVKEVLNHLEGEAWLMTSLLYGCGLRLTECLRLRVKDVDFEINEIMVRDGKGNNYRRTVFPLILKDHLQQQLSKVKLRFEKNLRINNFRGTSLPMVIACKYTNAPMEFGWQYIFPSKKTGIDPI